MTTSKTRNPAEKDSKNGEHAQTSLSLAGWHSCWDGEEQPTAEVHYLISLPGARGKQRHLHLRIRVQRRHLHDTSARSSHGRVYVSLPLVL